MRVFSFMQITGYSLEVNGFKTGKKKGLTATYVPSAAIEMILAFQSPFELYCKILYPIKRAGMKFDEADNSIGDETPETLNGTHRCVCFHRLA